MSDSSDDMESMSWAAEEHNEKMWEAHERGFCFRYCEFCEDDE